MEQKALLYGPPSVFTENIFEDIRHFYFSSEDEITISDIKSVVMAKPSLIQHKLFVVTERVEFVDHLLSIKELLLQNKHIGEDVNVKTVGGSFILEIPEEIEFHGREYNGVDHDIEATCFYLLLTCIESVVGTLEHVDMAEWLIKNWDNICNPEETPTQCVKRAKELYYDQHGTRRNFRNAIVHNLSKPLQARFIQNYAIVKLSNHSIDEEDWNRWQGKNDVEKITMIANYLYDKVRSKFTHESHRSFFPSVPIEILPATDNAVLISITTSESENLLDLLRDTVKFLARNTLLI